MSRGVVITPLNQRLADRPRVHSVALQVVNWSLADAVCDAAWDVDSSAKQWGSGTPSLARIFCRGDVGKVIPEWNIDDGVGLLAGCDGVTLPTDLLARLNDTVAKYAGTDKSISDILLDIHLASSGSVEAAAEEFVAYDLVDSYLAQGRLRHKLATVVTMTTEMITDFAQRSVAEKKDESWTWKYQTHPVMEKLAECSKTSVAFAKKQQGLQLGEVLRHQQRELECVAQAEDGWYSVCGRWGIFLRDLEWRLNGLSKDVAQPKIDVARSLVLRISDVLASMADWNAAEEHIKSPDTFVTTYSPMAEKLRNVAMELDRILSGGQAADVERKWTSATTGGNWNKRRRAFIRGAAALLTHDVFIQSSQGANGEAVYQLRAEPKSEQGSQCPQPPTAIDVSSGTEDSQNGTTASASAIESDGASLPPPRGSAAQPRLLRELLANSVTWTACREMQLDEIDAVVKQQWLSKRKGL